MFRFWRSAHRVIGLASALILIVVALTGFVLANKDRWEWVKPATAEGGTLSEWTQMVPMATVAAAAIGAGLPELRSEADIDRVELHAGKRVFKVRARESWAEVQVCAATGQVLGVGQRWDQLAEQVHDLRWFHPALRDWVLPVAALALSTLAASGVGIYLTPVVRRWRYQRSRPQP